MNPSCPKKLAIKIKKIGKEVGFDQIGITDPNLYQETIHFESWMESNLYGNMKYFKQHSEIYKSPLKLLPNTKRIICCRVNYPMSKDKDHPIASFAQIQDYSSHIRKMLKKYAREISNQINVEQKVRVFAGNAPILEKALAAKAGIGWYGKNSILINKNAGSYFFLGEILTNLSLPIDTPTKNLCGDCFKCKESCPTNAIASPHKLDPRRCIAYLTIEHKESIPLELRPLIGNKVYGCDICQQVCPWNKGSDCLGSDPFKEGLTPNNPNLSANDLVEWFIWNEKEFKEKIKDTPMHRIKHELWLRNIAVALGNSPKNSKIIEALKSRLNHPSLLVQEHVEWALSQTK